MAKTRVNVATIFVPVRVSQMFKKDDLEEGGETFWLSELRWAKGGKALTGWFEASL